MQTKILLVDDNEDLLLITQVILKGQGYSVELAKTLEETQTALAGGLPALILMDVNLQGEDGAAFCRELKEAPATKDLRIILMSGDDDLPALSKSGADDFLAKPFDFTELLAKVDKQLVPAAPTIA